ncbi:hypothetical protein PR048_018282 [Dryococelus australis]|uniref:Uncharacterized protein n=1 Tax=Dryococelus australis TaxID=614101 RepID=A0ABQ9HC80_9NEOP|nr:hypothetical protein PR048_018282 [Dryococelus australis]
MLLDCMYHFREDEINDGCPGQNKNKTMVQFIYCLVHMLKLYGKIWMSYVLLGNNQLPLYHYIMRYCDFEDMKAPTDPSFP